MGTLVFIYSLCPGFLNLTIPSPQIQRVTLTPSEERALLSKVTWRLMPLLFFCYIIAYIDRINVGFAKLHLREALGVDEMIFGSVYGLGAGLFFITKLGHRV